MAEAKGTATRPASSSKTARKKDGPKKATGRPSAYTPEIGAAICKALAEGKSLRNIVKPATMPSSSMVYRWLLDESNKEFREQYELARNIQADILFEEILQIADTVKEGTQEIEKEDYTEIRKGDMLGHRRLQIDARKWYLSKVLPKKYGDKLDLTSGGEKLETDVSDQQYARIIATAREAISSPAGGAE